jgi:hypothetical protein
MSHNNPTPWGRFLDGEGTHHIPNFRRIDGNKALLLDDYRFERASGVIWTARKGLIYDGGSIPKLLWGLSTNPWADDIIGPATIHDYYCKLGRERASPYSSSDVHYCFYDGLRVINVSASRARTRWLSVKTFGPKFRKQVDVEPDALAAYMLLDLKDI